MDQEQIKNFIQVGDLLRSNGDIENAKVLYIRACQNYAPHYDSLFSALKTKINKMFDTAEFYLLGDNFTPIFLGDKPESDIIKNIIQRKYFHSLRYYLSHDHDNRVSTLFLEYLQAEKNKPSILQELLNVPDHAQRNELTSTLMRAAARRGDFFVFQKLWNDPQSQLDLIIEDAVDGGNLEIIQYLIQKVPECLQKMVNHSIVSGEMHVVEYLTARCETCTPDMIDDVVAHYRIDVLEYLSHLFPLRKYVKTECLQRIISHNQHHMADILLSPSRHIPEYLIEELNVAFRQGYLEMAKVVCNKYQILDPRLAISACESGNVGIIELLTNQGVKLDDIIPEALYVSCKLGHLDVVKYFVHNGVDLSTSDYKSVVIAASYGHLELVDFIIGEKISRTARRRALEAAHKYAHIEVCDLLAGLSCFA